MRVDGFEVSATGPIPENRNLIADYTRLESEIVRSKNRAEAGRQFADVAPDTLSPRTTCNLPHGVQIGGGATFVDRRDGNTTNAVRVPSYLRYDAAVPWEGGRTDARPALPAQGAEPRRCADAGRPGARIGSTNGGRGPLRRARPSRTALPAPAAAVLLTCGRPAGDGVLRASPPGRRGCRESGKS